MMGNTAAFSRRTMLALSAGSVTTAALARSVASRDAASEMDRLVLQQAFNGAVLVAVRGQVLLSRGYGYANFEFLAPNTPATPFKIGSISKLFTAQALLMLVDAGKVSLDDPLSKHVDGSPSSWNTIRLHNLLDHSSGIPDIVRVGDFGERMLHTASLEKIVTELKTLPLDFPPGTDTQYGNSGPIVAAYIVQTISGLPFTRFLDQRVYEPLGMRNSGWADNAKIIPGRASGYQKSDGALQNASYIDMTLPIGAGAQYSSVEDLQVWWQSFAAHRLLSPRSTAAMFRAGAGGYGLGWKIEATQFGDKISHIGDINGFGSYLCVWPKRDVFCVALSNIEKTDVKTICENLGAIALAA